MVPDQVVTAQTPQSFTPLRRKRFFAKQLPFTVTLAVSVRQLVIGLAAGEMRLDQTIKDVTGGGRVTVAEAVARSLRGEGRVASPVTGLDMVIGWTGELREGETDVELVLGTDRRPGGQEGGPMGNGPPNGVRSGPGRGRGISRGETDGGQPREGTPMRATGDPSDPQGLRSGRGEKSDFPVVWGPENGPTRGGGGQEVGGRAGPMVRAGSRPAGEATRRGADRDQPRGRPPPPPPRSGLFPIVLPERAEAIDSAAGVSAMLRVDPTAMAVLTDWADEGTLVDVLWRFFSGARPDTGLPGRQSAIGPKLAYVLACVEGLEGGSEPAEADVGPAQETGVVRGLSGPELGGGQGQPDWAPPRGGSRGGSGGRLHEGR